MPDGVVTLESAHEGATQQLFQMHAFYISKNFSGCANEKMFMSCWRLQYQGTRSVVAVPFHQLHHHMKSVQGHAAELDYAHVWEFLHKATSEDLVKISSTCALFYGSVGPGEVLHLPYGFVLSEVVESNICVAGLRVPFLLRSDSTKAAAAKALEYLKQQDKGTEVVELQLKLLEPA